VPDARRNVELKAAYTDPEGTLARALAAGARDMGEIVQRDTFFAAPRGRLKLREEQPGGAHLIAYERGGEAAAQLSAYRIAMVEEPERLREALSAALGVTRVVEKRRHLLLRGNVRIHLDDVAGLGRFVEIEAVAGPESDLEQERAQVADLRAALGIEEGALLGAAYADALAAPDEELVALARAAAGRAYAPYSGFPVGAAVRTADGRRYAGANVENAAYPQGQCAEASAIGAMVAGGGGPIVEVVVAAPAKGLVTPCGGCRQRLREFAGPEVPVHLADLERVKRSVTMGELLPLSFDLESA
jgi:homotetrameric cytidine deaminase